MGLQENPDSPVSLIKHACEVLKSRFPETKPGSPLEMALVPIKKAPETVRNRGFVQLIHTVRRTETAAELVPRAKA